MGEQTDNRAGVDRHHVAEVKRRERLRRRMAHAALAALAVALLSPIVWQQIDNRRFKPVTIHDFRATADATVITVWAGECESGARLARLVEDDQRVVIFAESLRGANDCEAPRFDVELRQPVGERLVIDGNAEDGAGAVVHPGSRSG